MSDKLGYVVLEVGGIQKYILSTGKLKEMIGGSELIESLSDNYLTDLPITMDLLYWIKSENLKITRSCPCKEMLELCTCFFKS